jgi:hypothetical protein
VNSPGRSGRIIHLFSAVIISWPSFHVSRAKRSMAAFRRIVLTSSHSPRIGRGGGGGVEGPKAGPGRMCRMLIHHAVACRALALV